ncbi:MAG: hypothetical protein V3V61_08070 [Gammaproteobacteria bacterium]
MSRDVQVGLLATGAILSAIEEMTEKTDAWTHIVALVGLAMAIKLLQKLGFFQSDADSSSSTTVFYAGLTMSFTRQALPPVLHVAQESLNVAQALFRKGSLSAGQRFLNVAQEVLEEIEDLTDGSGRYLIAGLVTASFFYIKDHDLLSEDEKNQEVHADRSSDGLGL